MLLPQQPKMLSILAKDLVSTSRKVSTLCSTEKQLDKNISLEQYLEQKLVNLCHYESCDGNMEGFRESYDESNILDILEIQYTANRKKELKENNIRVDLYKNGPLGVFRKKWKNKYNDDNWIIADTISPSNLGQRNNKKNNNGTMNKLMEPFKTISKLGGIRNRINSLNRSNNSYTQYEPMKF